MSAATALVRWPQRQRGCSCPVQCTHIGSAKGGRVVRDAGAGKDAKSCNGNHLGDSCGQEACSSGETGDKCCLGAAVYSVQDARAQRRTVLRVDLRLAQSVIPHKDVICTLPNKYSCPPLQCNFMHTLLTMHCKCKTFLLHWLSARAYMQCRDHQGTQGHTCADAKHDEEHKSIEGGVVVHLQRMNGLTMCLQLSTRTALQRAQFHAIAIPL